MLELQVLLAVVLHSTDMSVAEGYVLRPQVGVTLSAKGGILMRVMPRGQHAG